MMGASRSGFGRSSKACCEGACQCGLSWDRFLYAGQRAARSGRDSWCEIDTSISYEQEQSAAEETDYFKDCC